MFTKNAALSFLLILGAAVPALAHTGHLGGDGANVVFDEKLRQHLVDEWMQKSAPRSLKVKPKDTLPLRTFQKPVQVVAGSAFDLSALASISSFTPPAGNGLLMQASFAPFKPKVRFNWDPTTFFIESDNMPDNMPNRMVGITAWQQQIPLPVAYFANTTNPENDAGSLGYGQPNYWRIPLVPTPAASPIVIYNPPAVPTNFLRGAVALASNGVAIFNPANNRGDVSYEIGELDYYGGHCGMADDYHYHIVPMHLSSRFGGPLGDDKPVAWALDGYPIYGYVEPDGSARQALDSLGGHDHGSWGYHYHAIGNATVDATHPYGTPQSPYMMKAFRGTVVNFGNQVDGQPEVGSIRADNSGGYNAKAVAGAQFNANAYKNPVALTTDASGHLIEDTSPAAVASADNYRLRATINGTDFDQCWRINRGVTPRTLTITWRLPNTTMASVTNTTQFKLSAPATGTGSGITLQAGTVTLTNCSTTAGSTMVTCDSTSGLQQGAVVTGTNIANPPTVTTTYTPNANSPAAVNRLSAYPMAGWSELKLPDTGQVVSTTPTFGEDADYTINAQSFTDNGNGTITDNVTGLMWQKMDAGEMTWENAINNASAQTTGGYSDWRLPNPHELFSIFNHENNGVALNQTYFPQNGAGAQYWWSRDAFGSSTTNVWCANSGGGLGGKPKSETVSAGGGFRYHARYVRGAQNNMTHNYQNNLDGTITDLDTGLMWTQIPGPATNWEGALAYAEALTTGGYSDWRLPNIKELQTLTDYALATTSGGTATNLKPCIDRTMFAKTMAGCATTSGSPIVNCSDTTGLVVGMTVVDPYSVAGAYVSNATTPTITAINPGVSFTLSSNAAATGTGLTFRALPVATACWSSTSNKGTTTEAWLLELGVNNSVPVAEGPPRGSQGIISYQAKTASFPVFAVRTTSVATQISVSQGGSPLTDGVSAVGYAASGSKPFTITNTGVTNLTINSVTIDGTNATSFTLSGAPADNTVIAPNATVTFNVIFNPTGAATYSAALHIASSDTAVGAAFDVNLTGSIPEIGQVALNPVAPAQGDAPYVTAKITAPSGRTASQVQLTYGVGTGSTTTSTVFNETMSGTPTTNGWNGTGASYPWTTVIVNGNGNVNQSGAGSNHTAAVLLNNCTISGGTSVTCPSTTGLWPGMIVTGTGVPAGDTISQVNSATTFTLASAATNGTANLTVAGVTLTGCATNSTVIVKASSTTGGSSSITVADNTGLVVGQVVTGTSIPNGTYITIISGTNVTLSNSANTASGVVTNTNLNFGGNFVTCASTTGLLAGMGITGTGIPNGSTVYLVSNSTSFWLSSAATATNTNQNFTASGCGLQFSKGSTTLACSATTTNGIDVSGPNNGTVSTSATISFWASASNITASGVGWSLQLSTTTNATPVFPASTSTGAVTEFAAANHGYTLYNYTLQPSELSSNLKLRFNFNGNALGGSTSAKAAIDDITITKTTTNTPPVFTVTMYDDGTHGDAVAGDSIYTGQITDSSAQTVGALVNYSVKTSYNDATFTTLAAPGYTVTAPLAISTAATLSGALTSAAYSQALAATGGTGPYTWSVTAGALPPGILLGPNGTFSGTGTSAGTYNFTATATDSVGHTVARAFSLTVKMPPNVVVIITDDQGWGDVGYHTPSGQVQVKTPNMDSFATTGIRLERFYVTTVCSVTRSTYLTGRNPIRHATNNVRGTDLSEHLMPQTFKTAGYQTFMVGKWHMGGSDKNINHFTVNGNSVRFIQEGLEYAPYNRGWDSHYGQYSGAIDYYTHRSAEPESLDIPDWWLNGVQQDGPSEHSDSQGHGGWSPDLEADKAISHIQNRDPSKPMLLHVAFNSIHGPISAPQSLIDKYTALGVTDSGRRLTCAALDGMDQAMGRVLAALDAAGIANNTVVVWFGDNGGDETKGSFNDPLRGDKGDSYEGGLRTPAGIRWPGVLPAGVTSNQPLWVGDLFPTICAAAGVTAQNTKPMDGKNMWPALLAAGNSTTVSRGTPLVTDQAAPIAIYSYTDPVNGGTKDFKLRNGRVNNVLTPELFNLTDDPYETTDLIANSAYASIVTDLTAAINAITAENFKPYIGPPLITNSVAQGGTITLYAPFTSYPNGTPTTQWRKNGVNIGAGTVSQITDSASVAVKGSYAATLTLTNVSLSDAGTYDVVITNTGGTATSAAGTLTVAPNAPVLAALSAFTKGTSQTVGWAAIPTATGYTVQMSGTADFANILDTKTVSTTSATFTGLTSGSTYYFRATATDGVSNSFVSNVISSTQDASNPVVSITAPTNGASLTQATVNVQGTATDPLSGVASVTVNGVAAATADNYAHWSATVPLIAGSNTLTVTATDNAQSGGNTGTASVSVTLSSVTPVITSVSTGPTAPTYMDPVWVTARVDAGAAPLSQVRLSYDAGVPVVTNVFREAFSNTSSNNWNGTGALNAWTTTGAGNVRQAVNTSNNTVPISLTGCTTTAGSPIVTCSSTAALWPGMLVTGTNIAGSINGSTTGNTTVSSITDGTTFVLSQNASDPGSGLTLTAAGKVLTNCTTTSGSASVTCDSTAGLVNGMSLSGTGLANNATVQSVTSATTFTMNANPTTPGSAITITASGAAAEFNTGTASLTGSMFATTNVINTSGGNSAYVEFWVQTRDLAATNNNQWTFQVATDGNLPSPTYVTRLSEDWNSETVNLSGCVLNTTGSASGSTTVTCTSTAGLTTGRTVAGPIVYVNGVVTSGSPSVTGVDTTVLVAGMFVQGTGIPNNTRILTIDSVSSTTGSFTMSASGSTQATGASVAIAATCFASNATVSSITNPTTFVLNTVAYVNTAANPIAATATTVNHGYQLFHYDLTGAERGPNTKFRFQFAGYNPPSPTAKPRVSIDDIVVATTALPPSTNVTMYDDGLHGDGAAGDKIYGAAIPVQAGGTAVNYSVAATDTNNATTTSAAFTYTVNSALTDATIKNAEFLGMPTDKSVTLNVVATVDQYAYVEYGTAPGSYSAATPVTLFTVDTAKPEYYNPIEITIPNLQPDTEYYYRFRHRDTTATSFKTRGERSFHTARPRGRPFVFTVTADPHLDVNSDLPLFLRAMDNIAADGPDIHIDLGDIFMTDKMADGVTGVPAQFFGGVTPNQTRVNDRALFFRNQFERCCHSIPFFYTQGNHEAEYGYLFNAATDKQNNIPAWNLKARKAFYPTPVPDAFYTGNPTPMDYTGGTLGLLENYYAYEWGDALFIALDPFWNTVVQPGGANNDAWNWTLGKTQYDWLKATLQNSKASYKFVFMHHVVGGSTTLADGTTPNIAARGGVEVADKYEWGGKNADGSEGFASKRPGWDMPIHQLLVQNKVDVVFHGHDHLYAYQTMDGMVYLECPQPGTANFTTLGSAGDGKYTQGVLLPNSGHIRVTVGPNQALAEYVRAYRSTDENATRHNRDVSHSFTVLSSNSALAGLTLSAGTLSPAFASGTTSYTASVPNATTSITVTPTVPESSETVKVNNVTVASGSGSSPISLNVGANPITVLVTAPDGSTTSTYTFTVTRAGSSNANLSGLALSAGTLSPVFSSSTTSYTATVPNGTSSVTLTPGVADNTATVTVNGTSVGPGSPAVVPLVVGQNTITTLVTAQDGTTTLSYAVVVTRQTPPETWRETWFGTSSNSGNAADDADPYKTGLPNLLVYGLLGPSQNPATAKPSQLPQPQLSGGNYTMSFNEPAGVSGITYVAEWSTSLQSNEWTPVADSGSGGNHVFSVPVSGKTRLFMRLRLTRP